MKIIDGLSYDDVLLMPYYSDIKSRSEVDISTNIGDLILKVPIISANMDTITGPQMADAMAEEGGLGILHRYDTSIEVFENCKYLVGRKRIPIPSIGVQEEDKERAKSYFNLCTNICIDVAHGDHISVIEMINFCKGLGYKNIIAGNVATKQAALRLYRAGANIIKVGIGPGSLCTTRLVTGHGVPQLTAILNVVEAKNEIKSNAYWNYSSKPLRRMDIIADGGIKNSGDIVKALAAGANAVMVGRLFAGCDETPLPEVIQGHKTYRGMASEEAQVQWKGKVSNDAPEGESTIVNKAGSVKYIIKKLAGGIRSGLSYSGARNIKELQETAQFIKVSPLGFLENGPHGKNVSI